MNTIPGSETNIYRRNGVIAAEFAIDLLKTNTIETWTTVLRDSKKAVKIAVDAMRQSGASARDINAWQVGFYDALCTYTEPKSHQ